MPIIGVNTFINTNQDEHAYEIELARSTKEEKETQIRNLHAFWAKHKDECSSAIQRLKQVALQNGNIFEELMECEKVASLGQITTALYGVGGQYRRNM